MVSIRQGEKKMNTKRGFTLISLVAILASFLTGCSLLNPVLKSNEVLEKSIEEMKEIQSYTYTIEDNSQHDSEESITSTSTLKNKVIIEPFSMHMNRTNEEEVWGTINTEIYISDDVIYHVDDLGDDDNPDWMKFPLKDKNRFLNDLENTV
jgi:type II secretory pathway component PulJ